MSAWITRLPGPEAYDLIFSEHLAMLPRENQEIIERHMKNSTAVWFGFEDDELLCYLGIIPPSLLSDRAYLWLQTTDRLKRHVFVFIRYSQRIVHEMLESYPIIVGHTETDNLKAIRWLKWLGAEFGEPIHNGKALPFEIRAK